MLFMLTSRPILIILLLVVLAGCGGRPDHREEHVSPFEFPGDFYNWSPGEPTILKVPENCPVRSRLVPTQQTFYMAGKMIFDLELVNNSGKDLLFLSPGTKLVLSNINYTACTKPDYWPQSGISLGGPPDWVASSNKLLRLKAGEVTVLKGFHDVSEDYIITRPGKYWVQFGGSRTFALKSDQIETCFTSGELELRRYANSISSLSTGTESPVASNTSAFSKGATSTA